MSSFSDTFDEEFQAKICALALRDTAFHERCDGLLKPSIFDNLAHATLFEIASTFYATYRIVPDTVALTKLIKDRVVAKAIRPDLLSDIKSILPDLLKLDLSTRAWLIDQIGAFARHQAVQAALLRSTDHIDKGDFAQIEREMRLALEIGVAETSGDYDYFAEIESRTHERIALATGTIKRDGITTGVKELDEHLFHEGWGRSEMSLLMGAAKAGKSMGLGFFAANAALDGKHVLYVTLEVARKIIAMRLDAYLADTAIKKLTETPFDVKSKIEATGSPKRGKLMIEEFSTGSFKPSHLRRLIRHYQAKGIVFDMVVVDYADIMAPEHSTDNDIANFRSIYIDLRAIAQEEKVALLTATQTNRGGAKKVTADMTDVAEDFNKIRIADVVISINASDAEREIGEARLFFVASRNQQDGNTVYIKQERDKMKFISKVVSAS